ncbi:MAG: hypothetical protein JW821_06220 [Deltaproteobacteria bacterium]|nr:hypothetical protein [Deltaproteobacteria bacterium]
MVRNAFTLLIACLVLCLPAGAGLFASAAPDRAALGSAGVPGCRLAERGAPDRNPPEPDAVDPQIERQLKELLEELQLLEKDMREKFRKEILPHLKKEIERLREWLREFHPELRDPEPEPRKTHI